MDKLDTVGRMRVTLEHNGVTEYLILYHKNYAEPNTAPSLVN